MVRLRRLPRQPQRHRSAACRLDAVVIAGTDYDFDQFTPFAAALRPWVEAGGALITTGFGIYGSHGLSGSARTDFDAIVPVNTSGSEGYLYSPTVTPTGTHEIVNGVGSFFISDGYSEYPASAPPVDVDATVLATVGGTAVAAAKEVGQGRSVYLGPAYGQPWSDGNPSLRSGNADRLLEQAVAWAARGVPNKVDNYLVAASDGDQLIIRTTSPGDREGQPNNDLNPLLELLDSAGTVVASNDDGADDGRNAELTYTVPTGRCGHVPRPRHRRRGHGRIHARGGRRYGQRFEPGDGDERFPDRWGNAGAVAGRHHADLLGAAGFLFA